MGVIASQITSLTIVSSIVYSDADQRKHQSSVSLAFVRGIHRGPVNSPHKWPVTRKMFPFDDVITVLEQRGPPHQAYFVYIFKAPVIKFALATQAWFYKQGHLVNKICPLWYAHGFTVYYSCVGIILANNPFKWFVYSHFSFALGQTWDWWSINDLVPNWCWSEIRYSMLLFVSSLFY